MRARLVWALCPLAGAIRTTPQAVEEYMTKGFEPPVQQQEQEQPPQQPQPWGMMGAGMMGFPQFPQQSEQQAGMGFPLQQSSGIAPAQQQQAWGAWPGALWNPIALAKPVREVPQPRVLVPGWGIFDMPSFGSYAGLPAQPEPAEDDDSTSSYNATEVLGSRDAEIARLRVQIRISFHKELHHMTQHGLRDGASLLELGCGPGWSTQKFAEALPSSSITCVELDEGMVRAARALLADEARVTIKQGLAQQTGLPDASFDFVTMRFLLQHLRRPSRVLREALRVLKPGGSVAVVETDDMLGGVMDPLIPALQPLNMKFSARQAHKGGSRFVGRHLLRMLRALGFEERHAEASLAASDEFDEGAAVFAPHFDVSRFQVLLDEGQLSQTEYEQAKWAMKTFLDDPNSIAMMVNLVALASKPRDGAAAAAALPAPAPSDRHSSHHHHKKHHAASHAASSRLTPPLAPEGKPEEGKPEGGEAAGGEAAGDGEMF